MSYNLLISAPKVTIQYIHLLDMRTFCGEYMVHYYYGFSGVVLIFCNALFVFISIFSCMSCSPHLYFIILGIKERLSKTFSILN